MIFTTDDDSGGWSIEIYDTPDAGGSMEYLGRLDLFSCMLYIEGGDSVVMPRLLDRLACETWAAATIRRTGKTLDKP